MLWLKDKHQLLVYSKDNYLSSVNFHNMNVEQRWKTGNYSFTTFLNEHSLLGLGNKSSNAYNMQDSFVDEFAKHLIHAELNLFYESIVELNSGITATS